MTKEVYFVGAGISLDAPTCVPTGYTIVANILKELSPSNYYFKKLLELSDSNRVNKRNPHDYIRFELLFEVIRSLIDPQLEVLKFIDNCEDPNINHFALAEKAINGSVIITTNFDCLIEEAILKLGAKPISICYNTDFRWWETYLKKGYTPVFKIHGSFRRYQGSSYKRTPRTIKATLDKITSNVRSLSLNYDKHRFLTQIFDKKKVIVAGYSGSDDFDIIPTFKQLHFERLVWLEHDINSIKDKNITKRFLAKLKSIDATHLSQKEEFLLHVQKRISIYKTCTKEYLSRQSIKTSISFPSSNIKCNNDFDVFLKSWGKTYLSQSAKNLCIAEIFLRLNRRKMALNCISKALDDCTNEQIYQCQIVLSRILISIGKPSEIKSATEMLEDIVLNLENSRDKVEYAEALHLIGFVKSKNGEFSTSIHYFDRSIKNASFFGHKAIVSNSLHDKAIALTDLGRLNEANYLFQRSIQKSNACGDIKHTTWSLYHLACNHYDLSNLSLALRYLSQAFKISHLLGDFTHLSNIHHLIGQIQLLKGDRTKAIEHLKISVKYDIIGSSYEYSAMTWQQIGVAYLEAKEYKEAEECFKKSQSLYKKHVDKYALIELMAYWCWLKLETGNKQAALRKLKKAKEIQKSSEHVQYSMRLSLMKVLLEAQDKNKYSFQDLELQLRTSNLKLLLYDLVYLVFRLGLNPQSLTCESVMETKNFYKKIGNRKRLNLIKNVL